MDNNTAHIYNKKTYTLILNILVTPLLIFFLKQQRFLFFLQVKRIDTLLKVSNTFGALGMIPYDFILPILYRNKEALRFFRAIFKAMNPFRCDVLLTQNYLAQTLGLKAHRNEQFESTVELPVSAIQSS